MDLLGLARRLEAAFAEGPAAAQKVLHPMYAAEVVLRHHPDEAPGDGVREGVELAAFQAAEAEALADAFEDYRQDDVRAEAEGDRIAVRFTMRGTMAGGDRLEVPVRLVYSFDDGRVVAMDASVGVADEGGSPLAAALEHLVPDAEGAK
jgi:ketosteroid isomerase-like protein